MSKEMKLKQFLKLYTWSVSKFVLYNKYLTSASLASRTCSDLCPSIPSYYCTVLSMGINLVPVLNWLKDLIIKNMLDKW